MSKPKAVKRKLSNGEEAKNSIVGGPNDKTNKI